MPSDTHSKYLLLSRTIPSNIFTNTIFKTPSNTSSNTPSNLPNQCISPPTSVLPPSLYQGCKLSLFAVVVHKGSSLGNGHYIAYVKTPTTPPPPPTTAASLYIHSTGAGTGTGGTSWCTGASARDSARASARASAWYRIDDEEVVAVTEGEALSQRDAYILFYQQQPPQPSPRQQQQHQSQPQTLLRGPCHAHQHGLALGLKIPLRASVKAGNSPLCQRIHIPYGFS